MDRCHDRIGGASLLGSISVAYGVQVKVVSCSGGG